MRLSHVVAHLRQYCPTLAERIAIAIEFETSANQARMTLPMAVVMVDSDDAEPPRAQNVSTQDVTDRFAVVLRVATANPQRGDASADVLHELRAEVWRALVGWEPGPGYGPVEYVGGELMEMNRAVTDYILTFASEYTLGEVNGLAPDAPPETWQEYELAGLPRLEALDVEVDVIDPIADPNLRKPGPDGRIEFELKEELP